MPPKTIRDALLRRKSWIIAIEILWFLAAFASAMIGSLDTALSMPARMAFLAAGALLYVSGLLFIPSRWLRCPRCAYPVGSLSIRRKKSLQINVCPHCGLALDAPLDEARAA